MAKPIKIWTGSEWVDVAIQSPSISGLATTSALTTHEADTTNVHGITDTSQLATQTYVNTQVANLVNSAPSTLDTLDELAQALNDDANFATTITNSLAAKANLSGATFTGNIAIEHSNEWNVRIRSTNSTSTNRNHFIAQRANGSSAVTNGFNLGGLSIAGYDGVNYSWGWNGGAEINAYATETWSPTARGTSISIWNTPNGTTTITERLKIDQNGRIQIPAGGILEAPISTNSQITSYTLVLTDAGRLIEINSSSATTLTIPSDASVNFPVGTKIDVLQTGTGQITIAGSGFTPNATPGLKISAQWGAASLIKRGTNSWVVIGNLSA